jgi:hypothetical protein
MIGTNTHIRSRFCWATNHPQDQPWGGGRGPRSSGPTAATAQEPQRRPDFLVLFFADFLVLLLDFDFLAAIMYHLLSIVKTLENIGQSQPTLQLTPATHVYLLIPTVLAGDSPLAARS